MSVSNGLRYFATVPTQEILPIVNSRFESSERGIFVIGDVTGLPLVKIAANQGVEVIAAMHKAGRFAAQPAATEQLDLVIIGGGPAGISAAIEAQKLGLRYVVLERNKLASTVRSFPPGKMVYAEPQFVSNKSDLAVSDDLDKDQFLQRMDEVVQAQGLHVKEDTEVTRVRKLSDQRFEVETQSGQSFPARQVLIAIGRQGQPRLLECPGADDSNRVTYRLHSPADYQNQKIVVVGGGNSAIEAALLLMEQNQVTLSYRGDDLFRAKASNREQIEKAAQDGRLKIVYKSQVKRVTKDAVELDANGQLITLPNDQVIVQIGTLPPVDFLLEMGLELDGIWTARRVMWALAGLLIGYLIYFQAKHFVLLPESAGDGKILIPGLQSLATTQFPNFLYWLCQSILPIAWLGVLALTLVNSNMQARGRQPVLPLSSPRGWLGLGLVVYALSWILPSIATLDPALAGEGPYYLPGLSWLFSIVPSYFKNAYGFYYLMYFSAIAGFGLYWAIKSGNALIWRRNLTVIASQWTLWWGIPTFLVVFIGRNPWTPLIQRSLNAWPLNMAAFSVDPAVGPGDPAWWNTVAVVGVVWATILTFVVIPIITLKWGKIYCSYICSCGALAETVGNGFRHRGPKGDAPRKWEKAGFVFIGLATIATVASMFGFTGPLHHYNLWVGTGLAGAVAIGMYPFLGQRVWCRMWCPLAFWMNFWGRWSKFKISSEPGKCIDCNVCNQYCQMGIDIKSRAMQGKPVTLVDTPCVGCAECVVRCPMQILHLGELPKEKDPAHMLPIVDLAAPPK